MAGAYSTNRLQIDGPFPMNPEPAGQRPALTLDRAIQLTFSLYRYGFVRYFLIGLVLYFPIAVIGTLIQVQLSDDLIRAAQAQLDFIAGREVELGDVFPMRSFVVSFAFTFFVGVVRFLYDGGLIEQTRRFMGGEPAGATDSIAAAIRRIPTLLGAGVLVTVATIGLANAGITAGIALILANVVNGALQPGPIVFIGLIVIVSTIVLLIVLTIRLTMVVQAVMFEGRSIRSSLSRSWRLVAGSGMRVLGYSLAFGLLVGAIGLIVGAVIELTLGSGIKVSGEQITFDPVMYVISGLLSSLVTIALAPIPVIALTLLFLDIRYRREGVPPERVSPVASVPEQQV